jgi:prolyl-tRNA synthetase
MRWSQALIPTLKEDPAEAEIISHKLMIRAGLIRKLTAGAYTYLPLGWRILNKVENIIREEMDAKGAQEILMPALQPSELWKESGRYTALGEDMIKFIDRHGKETILGPTHEEIITDLVRGNVKSYKELPLILYQIQVKFRDEIRPRSGVLRSREFIMKDAYSFDRDTAGLDKNYQKMYAAYCAIFTRCGLKFIAVEADTGVMGGDVSHEFMVLSESGEDTLAHCAKCGYAASLDKHLLNLNVKEIDKGSKCPKCGAEIKLEQAIEVGHVFKLGIKYSKAMSAKFLGEDGKERIYIMGCYGIGVNRIIAALIEQSHDKDGIIWHPSIAPYTVAILPLNTAHPASMEAAEKIYAELASAGIECILDDRPERAGVKFKDSDLIGFPVQIIIGEKKIANGEVEIKDRKTKEVKIVKISEAVSAVKSLLI